jgi:hypothetical protein
VPFEKNLEFVGGYPAGYANLKKVRSQDPIDYNYERKWLGSHSNENSILHPKLAMNWSFLQCLFEI